MRILSGRRVCDGRRGKFVIHKRQGRALDDGLTSTMEGRHIEDKGVGGT
jgi:hypothetical protein